MPEPETFASTPKPRTPESDIFAIVQKTKKKTETPELDTLAIPQ